MNTKPSSDFHLYKSNEWVMYLFLAVYISLFLLIVSLLIAYCVERKEQKQKLEKAFRLMITSHSIDKRIDDYKLTQSTKLKSLQYPKSMSSLKGSLYAPNRLQIGVNEILRPS